MVLTRQLLWSMITTRKKMKCTLFIYFSLHIERRKRTPPIVDFSTKYFPCLEYQFTIDLAIRKWYDKENQNTIYNLVQNGTINLHRNFFSWHIFQEWLMNLDRLRENRLILCFILAEEMKKKHSNTKCNKTFILNSTTSFALNWFWLAKIKWWKSILDINMPWFWF